MNLSQARPPSYTQLSLSVQSLSTGFEPLLRAYGDLKKVPIAMTGTAVGVISLVGYPPDIFLMPIAGWLIDRSPGAQGHQDFFTLMLGIALLGLGVVLGLNRKTQAGDLHGANTH